MEINGVRIIDTILDALYAKEIKEIYIVVGYKKEQFEVLKEKYPTIKMIENPLYNEAGNIASLYFSREHLGSSYIIEADLFILNKEIFQKYEYCTNYRGIFEEKTDDWCFKTKNKLIKNTSIGGTNVYRMAGISFWTLLDSEKLKNHLELTFKKPGGKENFWDKIPLQLYKSNYHIIVYPFKYNDIFEIDCLQDLKLLSEIPSQK